MSDIDIQKAVRQSIQTEKNAMDFYKLGAGMMTNPEAKRVFNLLASEEKVHASQFHKVYTGTDIPDFEAFMAEPVDNEASWMVALQKVIDSDFTEQKAMELAMEKELALEKALRETASRVEDPDVREVFDLNARETHNHYELIESEYARIMGMVHESDMDIYVRE
jgi:rubrerythrin